MAGLIGGAASDGYGVRGAQVAHDRKGVAR